MKKKIKGGVVGVTNESPNYFLAMLSSKYKPIVEHNFNISKLKRQVN